MPPCSLLSWCSANRDEPAKEAPSLFVGRAIRGFAAVGVPMDFTCWDKTVQIVVPILLLSGLAVLLAILAVGLLFFFIWQVLLDPRIGSPLVFALKLAEVNEQYCLCLHIRVRTCGTLHVLWEGRSLSVPAMQSIAILGKMSIKWPDRTREFFDIIAVVNFNTDMFRLECLFGHPEPIKTATFTAISPAVAFLIGVLAFPLVRMVAKARSKQDKAANSAVEELCKPVISHAPLQFQPVDVLAVASFWQYLCLLSVVKPTPR